MDTDQALFLLFISNIFVFLVIVLEACLMMNI